MPTIAITHAEHELQRFFPEEDLARLRQHATVVVLGGNDPALVIPQLAEVDILLGAWGMPKLTPELLTAAPRLTAVCYAAGSVKGFVTRESYARGVVVTTAMDANAIPVAETTAALITLAAKNWFRCLDRIRAEGQAAWAACRNDSHHGNFQSTVGLVGFGAIARLVQQRLRLMDVTTLVFDPYAPDERIATAGAQRVGSLLELARRSRVVSVHAPDIPANERMFDAAFFAAMPDGAAFVNTARGRLVDEAALIAALQGGRIDAYLDVSWPEPPAADSPLYRLPNCWLSPHRAGSTGRELRRLGRYAIDECLRVLAGEAPLHPVLEHQLATMA